MNGISHTKQNPQIVPKITIFPVFMNKTQISLFALTKGLPSSSFHFPFLSLSFSSTRDGASGPVLWCPEFVCANSALLTWRCVVAAHRSIARSTVGDW